MLTELKAAPSAMKPTFDIRICPMMHKIAQGSFQVQLLVGDMRECGENVVIFPSCSGAFLTANPVVDGRFVSYQSLLGIRSRAASTKM
jgi:hypothetical protein